MINRPTMFSSGRANVRLPTYRPTAKPASASYLSVRGCLLFSLIIASCFLIFYYSRVSRSACDAKIAVMTKELAAAQDFANIMRSNLQDAQNQIQQLKNAQHNNAAEKNAAGGVKSQREPRVDTPLTINIPSDIEQASPNTHTARAVVVFCYNRPEYLRRTLTEMLEKMPKYNRPHVYVSQDKDNANVARVIDEMKAAFLNRHPDIPFTHWQHMEEAQVDSPQLGGYYKLAQHFKWALDKLFVVARHPRVIILEDDIEIATDFFDYFTATENVLQYDDTLLAVSAYNDLGQAQFVDDPRLVLRSDFFPGLGWMLTRHMWEELGPKWPKAFWDDWLREPAQRKGRQILHPEVSRTLTFGEQGVSQSQFYAQYLGNIKLNDIPVAWDAEDLSYLDKAEYDDKLERAVAAAKELSEGEIAQYSCKDDEAVKTSYTSLDTYPLLAHAFGFIDDVKANVPRTAYRGVVRIHHRGCVKYLVPAEGILAP